MRVLGGPGGVLESWPDPLPPIRHDGEDAPNVQDDVTPEDPGGDPPSPPVEIVVVDRLDLDAIDVGPDARIDNAELARAIGELAMVVMLRSARLGISRGRALIRAAASSGPGRMVSGAVAGALDALGRDGRVTWRTNEPRLEEQLGRVVAFVAPVVVQSLDPEELIEALDVDTIVSAVDVNALLERVDIEALLERVDIEALLERVDVNALARRARIGELVAESTGDVAGSALDVGRRQAVGLDTLLAKTVDRVLGRDASSLPQGPPALDHATEGDE